MGLFTALADHRNPGSLSSRFRRRRHALLRELLARVPRPARMLDVGGTQAYWDAVAPDGLGDVHITVLNTDAEATTRGDVAAVAGDARRMSGFATGEFDVVFSNSVIEHVGGREEQRQMAAEIQRVGRRYYVQTPNHWFPVEPHFLMPGFQYLPVRARVALVRRFRLGWMPRTPDAAAALALVESIQLLDEAALVAMFPAATLHREQIGPLTKSLVVYRGFDA